MTLQQWCFNNITQIDRDINLLNRLVECEMVTLNEKIVTKKTINKEVKSGDSVVIKKNPYLVR